MQKFQGMNTNQNTNRGQLIGAICVVLSAILFGCTALFTMIAYRYGSNPFMAAFGRCSIGALILGLMIALSPKLSFKIPLRYLGQLALLSVTFAATMELLFTSYTRIGSGLGTTLHFTYPVVVIVILALFYHEPLTPMKLVCSALCIAGVLCLYTPGESGESIDKLGVIVAIMSGVTFALYIVFLGKSGMGENIPVLEITFWLTFFSAIMTGLFAEFTGTFVYKLAWQGWLAHLGLGIFISAMASTLLQKGIFLCGGLKASLLSNLEPVTATILGILFFHETFTLRMGVGVFFILAAAILTSRN